MFSRFLADFIQFLADFLPILDKETPEFFDKIKAGDFALEKFGNW